jgi:hypothetical protein
MKILNIREDLCLDATTNDIRRDNIVLVTRTEFLCKCVDASLGNGLMGISWKTVFSFFQQRRKISIKLYSMLIFWYAASAATLWMLF